MKAISVRQPWAWLLFHGKPVENRTWYTNFRGRVFIHASKSMTRQEWADAVLFVASFNPSLAHLIPPMIALKRGGIVGETTIVDCVKEHPSPFFVGPWGFVHENPKEIPFQPYTGAQGFFEVDPDTVKRIASKSAPA